MAITLLPRYAEAESLSVPTVDDKRKMQGASIEQTVASTKQVRDFVELRQSLDDLTQRLPVLSDAHIFYNDDHYVSSIKYGDGRVLSFTYEKSPTGAVTGVLIETNEDSSLRIIGAASADDGAWKMTLSPLPAGPAAGDWKEPVPVYEGIDSRRVEYSTDDESLGRERPPGKTFRFTKTLPPDSFERWLRQLKKPSKLQKRDFPLRGHSSFETDMSRLKEIFKDFEKEQKKAVQVYLKTARLEDAPITGNLNAHLQSAYEDIGKNPAVGRRPLDSSTAVAALSHAPVPETNSSHGPAGQGPQAAPGTYLRATETKTAREVLRSSLEKSLAKFNAKLEKRIPGRTTVKVEGAVTEIVIVLSES